MMGGKQLGEILAELYKLRRDYHELQIKHEELNDWHQEKLKRIIQLQARLEATEEDNERIRKLLIERPPHDTAR